MSGKKQRQGKTRTKKIKKAMPEQTYIERLREQRDLPKDASDMGQMAGDDDSQDWMEWFDVKTFGELYHKVLAKVQEQGWTVGALVSGIIAALEKHDHWTCIFRDIVCRDNYKEWVDLGVGDWFIAGWLQGVANTYDEVQADQKEAKDE